MAYKVDSYYRVGQVHANAGNPCEDYTLGGIIEKNPLKGIMADKAWIAVADGCSGAKAHTYLGAQANVFAFKSWVESGCSIKEVLPFLLESVLKYPVQSKMDRFATLIGATLSEGIAQLVVLGDGFIKMEYSTSEYKLIKVEWNNLPQYLEYFRPDYDSLFKEKGQVVEDMYVNDKLVSRSVSEIAPDNLVVLESYNVRAIHLFSDGVSQIGSPSLPVSETITDFTAFKNFEGRYVARRAMRAFKQYADQEAIPLDDFSQASIVVKSE